MENVTNKKRKLSNQSEVPQIKKEKSSSELEVLCNKNLVDQYQILKEKEESLDKEIASLVAEGATTNLEPLMQTLHEYNEMKDITQTVLGYLANAQQVTVKELHQRYNLPLD